MRMIVLAAVGLMLSGCTGHRVETPEIPKDAQTKTTILTRTAFQRGVRTPGKSSNKVPRLVEETYKIRCLTEYQGRPLAPRVRVVEDYVALKSRISDQILGDGYEMSFTSKEITRATYEASGCETRFNFATKTTNQSEIMRFLIENRLVDELMGRKRS